MTGNRQIRRVVIALTASVVLNGVLIAVPFFADPLRFPLSTVGRIAALLGGPAGAFAQWFLPGHGGAQVLLLIASSLLLYAAVAWMALTAWVWLRERPGRRPPGAEPAAIGPQ